MTFSSALDKDKASNPIIEEANAETTLSALRSADAQSNINSVDSTEGFYAEKNTSLADSGFQTEQLKSEKQLAKEVTAADNNGTPESARNINNFSAVDEYPKPEKIIRVDDADGRDDDDNTPEQLADIDELMFRAQAVGIDIREVLDSEDFKSSDISILLAMLEKEIIERELRGQTENLTSVSPEKGHMVEIAFAPDRIQDRRVRTFIEKTMIENPTFLSDLWMDATRVSILIDPDGGSTRISIESNVPRDEGSPNKLKSNKPVFISMEMDDFFRMCVVPEVDNGKSRIKTPVITGNKLSDYMSLFSTIENMTVDSKAIGARKLPYYSISLRRQQETQPFSDWSGLLGGDKIWQEPADKEYFANPGYPLDYAKANDKKRGY